MFVLPDWIHPCCIVCTDLIQRVPFVKRYESVLHRMNADKQSCGTMFSGTLQDVVMLEMLHESSSQDAYDPHTLYEKQECIPLFMSINTFTFTSIILQDDSLTPNLFKDW